MAFRDKRKELRDIGNSVGKKPALDVAIRSSQFPDAAGAYYEFDISVSGLGQHFKAGRRVEREDKEPYDPLDSVEEELKSTLARAGYELGSKTRGKYHFRRKETE